MLCRQLVLELDVVEVAVVDVEVLDAHRQVVARGVLRRKGVEHPVVVHLVEAHVATHRHEVYRELGLAFGRGDAGRLKLDNEVLEVVAVAGIDLHGLGNDLRTSKDNRAPVGQRHAVDEDTCAVGVALFIQLELEGDGIVHSCTHGGLKLVVELDGEQRGTVHRHVAALVDVDVHLGVL